MTQTTTRSRTANGTDLAERLANRLLSFGVIVTDVRGAVVDANEPARQMIVSSLGSWPSEASCCDLFGCLRSEPLADHCITRLALASKDPLPELRVDLPVDSPAGAVWITAARVGEVGSQVVLHLRPTSLRDRRRRTRPHWMALPQLRIEALGRTRVQTAEITIEGDWLLQRPGQLLKYLVCQRGRPAHVDEIVEALWPDAGVTGRNTVRHYVHILRERVEPDRSPRSASAFIASNGSAYSLDSRVAVDIEEFEQLVSAGLRGTPEGGVVGRLAVQSLENAMALYRGDLFTEEPFAEWAFAEREAVRALAQQALDRLVEHHAHHGNLGAATSHLERVADMRPIDESVQRQLIGIYMQQGRHSDASRRFANFRQRMIDEFGQEPSFSLAEMANNANKETKE